jgi:GNAT superfamily N-acetyltransferase
MGGEQMTAHVAEPIANLRPLTPGDLQAVVAIDYRHSASRRQDFYEKRLKAAILRPKDFIYLGFCQGDRLLGFTFARRVGGEFGGQDPAVALDAIGVDPDHEGKGIGAALIGGIDEIMRRKGVREMQTQSEWTDLSQLRFFRRAGFRHAPRIVLERDVSAFNEQPRR